MGWTPDEDWAEQFGPPERRPAWPRRLLAGLGLLLLAAAGSLGLGQAGLTSRPGGRTATGPLIATRERPGPLRVPSTILLAEHPSQPSPDRLLIPSAGVDVPIVGLGLNPDSTIQTPEAPGVAGWLTRGPAPGEVGPAVILGHLDSSLGPAVFWRLDQLRPGDSVTVTRTDGSAAHFSIERVAAYPRDAFPSSQVYGPTTQPELRLITCGGFFNLVTRQYTENVVAFATLAP